MSLLAPKAFGGCPAENQDLSRFHRNLACNFLGLVSKNNVKPLAIGLLANGAAAIVEQDVENFFVGQPERFEAWGEPGEIMGNMLVVAPIAGGMLAVSQKLGDERFRSMSYALSQGLLLNGALTVATKHTVGRMRPNGENSLSFPSGHTATSFTWATVASRTYGWKVGVPAYLAAGYVGATRLEENAHHLTDVVAGAAIGYIVGRTVTRATDQDSRFGWNVQPALSGGVSFQLQWNLNR